MFSLQHRCVIRHNHDNQFPNVIELLSEHSLRQAVGKLAGVETQLLEKDDKKQLCRHIESDANQKLLEQLRNDIGKII